MHLAHNYLFVIHWMKPKTSNSFLSCPAKLSGSRGPEDSDSDTQWVVKRGGSLKVVVGVRSGGLHKRRQRGAVSAFLFRETQCQFDFADLTPQLYLPFFGGEITFWGGAR
jgi:hypothetical protein